MSQIKAKAQYPQARDAVSQHQEESLQQQTHSQKDLRTKQNFTHQSTRGKGKTEPKITRRKEIVKSSEEINKIENGKIQDQ